MLPPGSLKDVPLIAGRYRIVRQLGEGGMGVVYEVIDETTNRRRALKRIRAHAVLDPEIVRRFEQEVTVAGRVESEHVVEVLDAGIDDATQAPYLVMELLDGEDLGALLLREGAQSHASTLAILRQVGLGLDRTHAEDVVHRDIKPENVFLSKRDDGSRQVKLLDFGVAKSLALDTLSPATTRIVGTPLYMAPEQFSGEGTIDARADAYALAQLAFTMLVGVPYFEEERQRKVGLPALAVLVASSDREPASVRARKHGVTLPAGFDAWFAKATAACPDDRFDTADRALDALDASLQSGPAALPRVALRAAAPWRVALLVMLTGGAVVAALAWSGEKTVTVTDAASPEEEQPLAASNLIRAEPAPDPEPTTTARAVATASSPASASPSSSADQGAKPAKLKQAGPVGVAPSKAPASASPSAKPYDPLADL